MPPATGPVHDYTGNPEYQMGQQLLIQWSTTWENVNLWLWQNDNPRPELLLQNQPNEGELQWHVKTSRNYSSKSGSNGNVFFLQLGQAGGKSLAFGSHYFNISGPSDSPTSNSTFAIVANDLFVALPTETATVSGNDQAASPSSTSSSQSAVDDAGNHNPNSALATGLGAGLGFVLAVLASALALLIILQRRRRAHRVHADGSQQLMAELPDVPVQQEQALSPIEIMGRRNTREFFHGNVLVHEMPDPGGMAAQVHGPDTAGRVGGLHEMPIVGKGGTQGIYAEKGCS